MVANKSNRTQEPCYVKLALQFSHDVIAKVKVVIEKKNLYLFNLFAKHNFLHFT